MKKTKSRLLLCAVYLTAVLCFIWGNSLLPGEDSGELSGFVGSVLQAILPILNLSSEQGMHLLRKFAHFSEFAALGLGFAWLFGMLFKKWLPSLLLPLVCGITAAGIDETIQIFSPNRGPGLKDVAIDSAGVLTGVAFLTLVHILLIKIRKRNHPSD